MNTTIEEGVLLYEIINNEIQSKNENDCKVIIAPPFTHLSEFSKLNYQKIELAAQNCAFEKSGAYTGEISAFMAKSAGASYILIGHSERRKHQNENHLILKSKIHQVLATSLIPIFCCGEDLHERENKNYFRTVEKQIKESLFDLSEVDFGKIIVAYEPVWAIGTGKTASPYEAQEMHNFIRNLIKDKYGEIVSEEVTILYGGSCNKNNAFDLFKEQDVDGGLIGGASLNVNDFISIIDSMNRNI